MQFCKFTAETNTDCSSHARRLAISGGLFELSESCWKASLFAFIVYRH